MYLPRGSVETGGRDGAAWVLSGWWSYHVRRAARNVGRDRIPFSLLTAGVVDFVGIGTWYDISACCSHRSRHS